MSSNFFLIAFFVAVVASPALATKYVIGDDAGWKLNFDYQRWAKGKQFVVGDKLKVQALAPSSVTAIDNISPWKSCEWMLASMALFRMMMA